MIGGRRPDPPRRLTDEALPIDMRRLDGRTVLIPRSPSRAEPLAKELQLRGAEVLVAPATGTEPAEPGPLEAAVQRLAGNGYAWVVVTSVNGATALAEAARRAGTTLSALDTTIVRWAAVGPATAAALADAGVHVDLVPGKHSGAGLVAAFPRADGRAGAQEAARPDAPTGPASTTVLLPLADCAAPTVPDGLRALGWHADVVEAYRTVPRDLPRDVRDRWAAGHVHAVVLTAPSVAREVARQLGPRDDVSGVAVGEPTAYAAAEAGLRVAAIAESATVDALAHAVSTALLEPAG